ncbi:MAG: hypothetical protein ACRDQB_11780 [Thermocrispum sp.]
MLTAIILLSFIAAAFWREAIKLTVAAVVVILVLGLVQLVQILDQAGAAIERESVSRER